jgi:hypothetical protein
MCDIHSQAFTNDFTETYMAHTDSCDSFGRICPTRVTYTFRDIYGPTVAVTKNTEELNFMVQQQFARRRIWYVIAEAILA